MDEPIGLFTHTLLRAAVHDLAAYIDANTERNLAIPSKYRDHKYVSVADGRLGELVNRLRELVGDIPGV